MNLRENIKKELRLVTEQVNPCDWNNFPTWQQTWTNNNAFQNVNNNPNQPCNHICTQLQTWDINLTNAVPYGPQSIQLRCKIMEGNNQFNIHNCSSSNAPAC
jgi:hypothetical protein|tara:strand:- start:677 stop:982 length:306 start_codon:yes stop_codon:yes gene_type:complete